MKELYPSCGIVFSMMADPQASPKQFTAVRKRSNSQSPADCQSVLHLFHPEFAYLLHQQKYGCLFSVHGFLARCGVFRRSGPLGNREEEPVLPLHPMPSIRIPDEPYIWPRLRAAVVLRLFDLSHDDSVAADLDDFDWGAFVDEGAFGHHVDVVIAEAGPAGGPKR